MTYFGLYRGLCTEVVGATSSEGYLVIIVYLSKVALTTVIMSCTVSVCSRLF